MRVFLTGGTGLIGSAIIPELIHAGHQVLALARSDAAAETLRAAGADPHHGSLEDLESLRSGAAQADGIIHCAFNHDFSNFKESSEAEKHAIETLGNSFAGSHRPLIVSSGLALESPTRPVTEDVDEQKDWPFPRIPGQIAQALRAQGVNVTLVRLPQVHNTSKQGLVTHLIAVAREKEVSAFVADGLNRWPCGARFRRCSSIQTCLRKVRTRPLPCGQRRGHFAP